MSYFCIVSCNRHLLSGLHQKTCGRIPKYNVASRVHNANVAVSRSQWTWYPTSTPVIIVNHKTTE